MTPVQHPLYAKSSALQKHTGFWDRDKDGVIYISETYAGFRALGFNALLSIWSAIGFHVLHVSYPTQGSWLPDPRFPVHVGRIDSAKHGSDTGTYTHEGGFNRQAFERIWDKFDKTNKGGLYFGEIVDMWRANRNVLDVVGWAFQVFLWGYLWLLAADANGVLRREDVEKQYDGTLYYEIEKRRRAGERLPWWRGGAIGGVF